MSKKAVSAIMMFLLVIGALALAFKVQMVRADVGTIIINADGSITPLTAPIYTADNITYTLTGNISATQSNGIVVERDNITVDGAGYTVQAPTTFSVSHGIYLNVISNVTIRNVTLNLFYVGIYLQSSSNNCISENNIEVNDNFGIQLNYYCNYNSISGNNITANVGESIYLDQSSNNNISGNNGFILELINSLNNSVSGNNMVGIQLAASSNYNSVSGNNLTGDGGGVIELSSSSGNSISGNNITANHIGILLTLSSEYIDISGNNITANNDHGIYLYSSSNNSVSGNNMTNNGDGIVLETSDNNSLSGNNVANNYDGIGLVSSSGNTL